MTLSDQEGMEIRKEGAGTRRKIREEGKEEVKSEKLQTSIEGKRQGRIKGGKGEI